MARPPTMGAAMRFMTSAPVPVLHMMGSRPMKAAKTVMALGRTRFTAPWMMASTRSPVVFRRPSFRASSWLRSRKSSMKTPVSASSPMRAMRPTHTAMLML